MLMARIGERMATKDYTLRSGAADGADAAFEVGCDRMRGDKEIYIPWEGFNNRSTLEEGVYCIGSDEAWRIAEQFHPNWSACSRGARMLHARNVFQVLGSDCRSKADGVVCWTPNASGSGGTGQALRIARHYNIPIYDLADPKVREHIEKQLEN